MKKIYISVPITGHETVARERADLLKGYLSRQGYEVVSPFDIYSGENAVYEDHICNDLREMLKCDAIFFCKGWQDSLGCKIEHDTARNYNESGRKKFQMIYENEPVKL